ncbi:MAG: hypothetical protein WC222_04790 [Parachlamydiales bacterium]|jgi:chromosome segregation ATPase
MYKTPPRKKKTGTKTIFALSTITAGLLALLTYEVFSFHDSPIIQDIKRTQSKPLIILDDESEQGYLIADNGYSIGKTPHVSERIETIEALKLQLHDSSRQMSDLRSQLMTKGTLTEHPRTSDLKKALAHAQEKYRILLGKKKIIKDELIAAKDQLETRAEMYRNLAAKKKEIKENYFELQRVVKDKDRSNRELAREVEELRILLANAENGKLVSDRTNTLLITRVQDLKDQLNLAVHYNNALQTDFTRKSVDFDELSLRHDHTEHTFKSIVNHHLVNAQVQQVQSDPLANSIHQFEPAEQRLAVNFPKSARLAAAPKAEAHLELLDQLAYFEKYGYSVADNAPAASSASPKQATEVHVNNAQNRIQKIKENIVQHDQQTEALELSNIALRKELAEQKAQLEIFEQQLMEALGAQALKSEDRSSVELEKKLFEPSNQEVAQFQKEQEFTALKAANKTLQLEIDTQKNLIEKYETEISELRNSKSDDEVADNDSKMLHDEDDLDLNPPEGQLGPESDEERKWTDEDKLLNKDIEHLQNELDASSTTNGALEDRLAILNKQIIELSEHIALNDWAIDHHRSSHENALSELEEAHEKIADKDNDLCASNSCSETLSTLVHNLNGQISSLQAQIKELEDKTGAYELLIAEKEEHHDAYTQKLDEKSREIDAQSRVVIAALQRKVSELQQNLAEAHSSADAYQDTIYQLNEKLKDEKMAKYAELGKFEKKVQNLNRKVAVLDSSNKPAPGIRPAVNRAVAKPRKENASQLAYMCSQVASVGSSAINLCNKSPEELLKEALKSQAQTKVLQEKLTRANNRSAEQEHRIKQLEARLLKAARPSEQVADNVYDEERMDEEFGVPYSYPYDYYYQPRTIEVKQEENIHDGERESSYSQKETLNDDEDLDNDLDDDEEDLEQNPEDRYMDIESYLALNDDKDQDADADHHKNHQDEEDQEEDHDPYNEIDEDEDEDPDEGENYHQYSEEQDEELDDDIDDFEDTDSDPLALNDKEEEEDEELDEDIDNFDDTDSDPYALSEEDEEIEDEYDESTKEVDDDQQAANDEKYWNEIAQNDDVDSEIDDEQPEDDYDDELAWDEEEDQKLDDIIEDFGNVDPDPSPPQ